MFDLALDPDLPFHRIPVEHQCCDLIGLKRKSFATFSVGEEHRATRIKAPKKNDPCTRSAIRVDGGQSHRIWIRQGGLPRLLHPCMKCWHRIDRWLFEIERVHTRSLASLVWLIFGIKKCFRLTDLAGPILGRIHWRLGRLALLGFIRKRLSFFATAHLLGMFEISTPRECCRGLIYFKLGQPLIDFSLSEGTRCLG